LAAKVEHDKCIGCRNCISVCPVQAIVIEEGKAKIGEKCIECCACAHVCPVDAIDL
jgi:ferredoxin